MMVIDHRYDRSGPNEKLVNVDDSMLQGLGSQKDKRMRNGPQGPGISQHVWQLRYKTRTCRADSMQHELWREGH